jgi:hypothetical protein
MNDVHQGDVDKRGPKEDGRGAGAKEFTVVD